MIEAGDGGGNIEDPCLLWLFRIRKEGAGGGYHWHVRVVSVYGEYALLKGQMEGALLCIMLRVYRRSRWRTGRMQ